MIANRAVTHWLAAGEANAAWPVAHLVVLALRQAGRYRDGLKPVERVLDGGPTGPARGVALTFSVQPGIRTEALPIDAEARLTEAERLVVPADRSFAFDELAKLCQRRGDLKRARTALERSIAVGMEVYGTEEHYSTAITETDLGVLLLNSGEAEKGLELLMHALNVFHSQLGPRHPRTQQLAAFLARLFGQGEGGGE